MILGHGCFPAPGVLEVGQLIEARAVVIATALALHSGRT
jgi:hypothetical protein